MKANTKPPLFPHHSPDWPDGVVLQLDRNRHMDKVAARYRWASVGLVILLVVLWAVL